MIYLLQLYYCNILDEPTADELKKTSQSTAEISGARG